MELLQAIKERRSVRFFQDKDVEKDKLTSLLEAATWAPTGGNIQPWYFIAVNGREQVAKIKAFSPGIIGSPKAIIIACIDTDKLKRYGSREEGELLATMDLSMACQNIMLAALGLGLGSCAVRSFNQAAVSQLTGLPNAIKPQLLIALGYPSKTPAVPPKLPLAQVAGYEKYGGVDHE